MTPVRSYSSFRISCRSGSCNAGQARRGFTGRATRLSYLHVMNNPDHSENENSRARIDRAMILAAGLGTRFKPWTDQHPKALAPINGKSLLQRNIEYLHQNGIGEVVVNVHHF